MASRATPPASRLIDRIGLFASMTVWYAGLTLLKPFVRTRRLVALAEPPTTRPRWQGDDVRLYLRLLRAIATRLRLTNCLPRALLAYRFLTLAGEQPTLVVGLDLKVGHAWVEVDGAPLYENVANLKRFQPIIVKGSSE